MTDFSFDKEFIFGLVTSKLFIVNCVLSYVWLWIAKRAIRPLIQKNSDDVTRDKKYDAFARKDLV